MSVSLYKIPVGGISEKRLKSMFALCQIRSEPIKLALKFHLVDGFDEVHACNAAQVRQNNFTRNLLIIQNVHYHVEMIKEEDWKHLGKSVK